MLFHWNNMKFHRPDQHSVFPDEAPSTAILLFGICRSSWMGSRGPTSVAP